ncbi:MAG: DEAD/DEAH box helicase family protein [Kiritimatiellae bacterium]|nr:DEAD/DEAH box helicase family protein [Kiritimatiellia bacterium]
MPIYEESGTKGALFEAFRRVDGPLVSANVDENAAAIQLLFDDDGAYLEVVDKKGRPQELDHRACRGAMRDLLKALNAARDRQEAFVGWDENVEHVYLHTHGHLLWLLRNCNSLVDVNMHPLTFAEDRAELLLELLPDTTQTQSWVTGRITLMRDGEACSDVDGFKIINETHILLGSRIYETDPLGENCHLLPLFNDLLPESMLERLLSLLFSHFTGVNVRYGDYQVVPGEETHAVVALMFQQVDESGALHMDVVHMLSHLPVEFIRSYDITRLAVINEAERTIVVRNVVYGSLVEERKRLTRLLNRHRKTIGDTDESLLYVDENGFVLGTDLASRFLTRELGDLAQRYTLLGAETLSTYKVKSATPKLKLNMGYGIDFLEGHADLEIEGETFSLLDVLAQHRKNRYVTLTDGTHAVLNSEYLSKLNRLFRKHEQGVKVSFFDLPLIEDLIDENAAEAQFSKAREVFRGFNTLSKKRVTSPAIQGTLRPYQKDGLKWLNYLHQHGLGGCLADDMGLGKTVQAIALLSRIYPKQKMPSLLIMPRSLLFNWRRELETFCPALRHHIYHGPDRDLDAAMSGHLVLTTYGMLRNNIEDFVKRHFLYVILDESQAIKNSDTQTTKAVLTLKAKHRLALSGTPIENNLGELYSLFRFLNPAMFGSAAEFSRDYATPIHQNDDREAARELRKKIYPFILRRLKRDVLKDLPDKIEQVLYVDMSTEQRKLYDARRRFYYQTIKQRIADEGLQKSRFFILEALMELRQVASIPEAKSEGAILSPKREALMDRLQDAVSNGHKALVFTNFLATIEYVAADLKQCGIEHLVMTGATGNREALVKQFQTRSTTKVFLMTLKTGGVGLNLTAADMVFIFDPWWNSAAEIQAVDRTHRIGQDKTVFTYKLIAKDSIEEKIVELQTRKKQLFDSIISSDGVALKSLTEQDIDDILG